MNEWAPGGNRTVYPNAPEGLLFPGDTGRARSIAPNYYKAFMPRLGVAWDPTGSGHTTVRAGYGDLLRRVHQRRRWTAAGCRQRAALDAGVSARRPRLRYRQSVRQCGDRPSGVRNFVAPGDRAHGRSAHAPAVCAELESVHRARAGQELPAGCALCGQQGNAAAAYDRGRSQSLRSGRESQQHRPEPHLRRLPQQRWTVQFRVRRTGHEHREFDLSRRADFAHRGTLPRAWASSFPIGIRRAWTACPHSMSPVPRRRMSQARTTWRKTHSICAPNTDRRYSTHGIVSRSAAVTSCRAGGRRRTRRHGSSTAGSSMASAAFSSGHAFHGLRQRQCSAARAGTRDLRLLFQPAGSDRRSKCRSAYPQSVGQPQRFSPARPGHASRPVRRTRAATWCAGPASPMWIFRCSRIS